MKVRLLFEPAVLLVESADADELAELAAVSTLIPITGNYGLWEPARANVALCSRAAHKFSDAHADQFEQFVCWPENGEKSGPVLLTTPAINRANGVVVEQLRTDFTPPLNRAELSHTIARIRELGVMWVLGGSQRWPRTRIDDEIAESFKLVSLSGFFS